MAEPRSAGRARRRGWRGLLAVLGAAIVTVVGPMAGSASAHTRLVESEPPTRAVLDEAPSTLRLIFAHEVDPTTVSAQLKRLDGSVVDGVARTTPDAPHSFVVEFSIPAVEAGTYGLPWQAIGPDGHRVAGEVVFGFDPAGTGAVSAEVASASFDSVSGADRALDAAGVLSRAVWYLGLALAVGGLAVLWLLLAQGSVAARRLQRAVQWWTEVGVGLALVAAFGRWVVAALVLRRAGVGDGSAAGRSLDALREASGGAWVLALGALALALVAIRRLDAAVLRDRVANHAVRTAGICLATAAVASVASGHAASYPSPLLSELVAGAHLLAAAAWVGPLAVVTLGAADASFRSADARERAVALARVLRGFSPVAIGALGVLVVTGVRTISVTAGTDLLDTSWGQVVALKVALVAAVAVPLGLHHHRRVRAAVQRADEHGERARTRVAGVGFARSLQLETGTLLVVAGLGALLLSLTPSFGISEDELAALRTPVLDEQVLSDGPVTDVASCVDLEIGKPDCYREYFATIMRTKDASAAVDEIERLSVSDEFVTFDCHQIAHNLGEDAIDYYGGLAKAFQYGGAACWSGYYHGIVETELSLLSDEQLIAELPSLCEDVAEPAYTFDHYNCVHGAGHGVMLRTEDDLFRSLELCGEMADVWEQDSCYGGAFMENVIAAQAGKPAVFKDDDPLYPCTAVPDDQASTCMLMQTSYVLWKNGYDFEEAFAVCNTLEGFLAENCYQSMGRDISGTYLLDVDEVIAHCDLGADAMRGWCYAGASLNAVFNDHNTAKADELCAAVEERWRAVCESNRDSAASTL